MALALATAIAAAGAGCDARADSWQRDLEAATQYANRDLTTNQRYGGAYAGGTATGDTKDGAGFARWVLDKDPDRRYITDAVVRNEQTLGVKVQPSVTERELQRLLESLAEGMAQTFPGRPLAISAFHQSGNRLVEATYDPRTALTDVRFTS